MSIKDSKEWQLGFEAGMKVRAAEISVLVSQIHCLSLDLKEFTKAAQIAIDNYKKFHNTTQESPEFFGSITSQTLRTLEWWIRRMKNTLVVSNADQEE